MKKYITLLAPSENAEHEWNGNEKGGRGTQHESISLSEDPATITLTWATDSTSPKQYIGTYKLFLKNLLEDGLIGEDSKMGYVRVKFVNVDGLIKLSRGKRAKESLVVGEFAG